MMDFAQLQHLLADWYEVPASKLGAPEGSLPRWMNPILRDFYHRFGALTQSNSQFTHPASHHAPLSCQDHVIPLEELRSQDGFTVFCKENQGIFVVAACNDQTDLETYAMGDAVSDDCVEELTAMSVPLQECLVTCVLRETIMSVGDRYRRITPATLKTAQQTASTGESIISRYIWPDTDFTFNLSKDVWFMEFGDMQFAAHRGLWRLKPATWQEKVFKN